MCRLCLKQPILILFHPETASLNKKNKIYQSCKHRHFKFLADCKITWNFKLNPSWLFPFILLSMFHNQSYAKIGIVLPRVLPKKLFLYTESDRDMIYNLDILLPLDTLGVLPVLLFLVSGSTLGTLIFCPWEYSCKSGIVLLETKNKSNGSTPRVSWRSCPIEG